LKRAVVDYLMGHHGVSQRRACSVLRQARNTHRYQSCKDARPALRTRMRELAQTRVRYGCRRLHVLLRREGWRLERNQACRIYVQEKLQLRSKLPRRRKMTVVRNQRIVPRAANKAWSMDFVADQLADGTKIRALTVIDVYTREALAIEVGRRMRGEDVVGVLNRLAVNRPAPGYLFVDNGSEFSGRALDLWAYHHKARIDFSRPGRPVDNCFVETFNGSFRDECLNVHWFETLEQARALIEAWRRDYNESRPHMALGGRSPEDFAGDAMPWV
jgi:putative transposase